MIVTKIVVIIYFIFLPVWLIQLCLNNSIGLYTLSSVTGNGRVKYMAIPFFDFYIIMQGEQLLTGPIVLILRTNKH